MTDGSITRLLDAVSCGEDSAESQLWRLLYDELSIVAQRQLAGEGQGAHGTNSLVHETFVRLTNGEKVQFANRRHFFGCAARVMRQIRVDDARRRKRDKRGGGQQPVPLNNEPANDAIDPTEIIGIHEALDQLEAHDSRKAEVVILRYFGGLSIDETAEALNVSSRLVDSEWKFARAWLHRELSKGDSQA